MYYTKHFEFFCCTKNGFLLESKFVHELYGHGDCELLKCISLLNNTLLRVASFQLFLLLVSTFLQVISKSLPSHIGIYFLGGLSSEDKNYKMFVLFIQYNVTYIIYKLSYYHNNIMSSQYDKVPTTYGR